MLACQEFHCVFVANAQRRVVVLIVVVVVVVLGTLTSYVYKYIGVMMTAMRPKRLDQKLLIHKDNACWQTYTQPYTHTHTQTPVKLISRTFPRTAI